MIVQVSKESIGLVQRLSVIGRLKSTFVSEMGLHLSGNWH